MNAETEMAGADGLGTERPGPITMQDQMGEAGGKAANLDPCAQIAESVGYHAEKGEASIEVFIAYKDALEDAVRRLTADDEVVNALNGESVDEAAKKATDCFVDEFTKEVEEIRAEREEGDDLARFDERENDLLARCVEVIAKGVAHPHAVAAAALGYMVEGDAEVVNQALGRKPEELDTHRREDSVLREEALTQIQHLAYDGSYQLETRGVRGEDALTLARVRLHRINAIAEGRRPDEKWIPIEEDGDGGVVRGGDRELLEAEGKA